MDTRIDAIYGRQSVDKKDSISIESQIEFCQYEVKGANHRTYTDKGFSGKNTDRPKFQELISDIKQGLISKVVVYKLDRISRSIIDFAKMMEMFQEHNVEFVSATEKFDTSTPMGRAMLNICIVFAQLERETIQKRVSDSYRSRLKRGLLMGGSIPYGYALEKTIIDGINTKKMVEDAISAEHIRLIFELYAKPDVSLGNIIRHFVDNDIETGITLTSSQIANMLRNPVYVKADLDIYEFYNSQQADIVNDAADFAGTNGCYFYSGLDTKMSKRATIEGHTLVLAPHEGLIESNVWLACRRKLLNNKSFPSGLRTTITWLAGKAKCGKCGSSLGSDGNQARTLYLRCRKRQSTKGVGCEGCGTIKTRELEQSIYNEMSKKLNNFTTLSSRTTTKANPKLTALKVELAQVDKDIEELIEKLTGASKTLMSYANKKIEELDFKRQQLSKAIADMKTSTLSPETLETISGYLDNWEDVDIEDKRLVVDSLISTVRATSDFTKIEWKV